MSNAPDFVSRAAEGDTEAFAALVTRFRPEVLRTAQAVLGDPASAEDVAQEAILRLHSALAGFRGDSELGTWLYRITLNLCRDQMRRTRRRATEVDAREAGDAPGLRVESIADSAVDAERTRMAVREAIARLPSELREVIELRYLEDLPYAEIARRTGTPQGTVASRVFRALERLGRDLEPKHLEIVT